MNATNGDANRVGRIWRSRVVWGDSLIGQTQVSRVVSGNLARDPSSLRRGTRPGRALAAIKTRPSRCRNPN